MAPGGSGRGAEYHANVGRAIRTLREELPDLFGAGLTYDIYTDDVGLLDEISPKMGAAPRGARGKAEYRRAVWGLRLHGWLFFERARLELHRIWQPMDGVICVRWTLRGVPRLLGPVLEHGGMHLDGISEYKLDGEGMIYQHRLDNLDFDSGLRLSLAQEVLARIQGERLPAGASWSLEGSWDQDSSWSLEGSWDQDLSNFAERGDGGGQEAGAGAGAPEHALDFLSPAVEDGAPRPGAEEEPRGARQSPQLTC